MRAGKSKGSVSAKAQRLSPQARSGPAFCCVTGLAGSAEASQVLVVVAVAVDTGGGHLGGDASYGMAGLALQPDMQSG